MNILFVNYSHLRSNSMVHIVPFANELCIHGHASSVVTEAGPEEQGVDRSSFLFAHYNYEQLLDGAELFPNAKPADIVHAWTPRENVRRVVQVYQSRFPSARLIIHLEDNEVSILESAYQRDLATLQQLSLDEPNRPWNQRLCHPIEFLNFLSSADGVSVLVPSLADLVPVPKPMQWISPILKLPPLGKPEDASFVKKRLGLDQTSKVIVYPGGITSSNRADIRDLYLAVRLLNQEGIPTRIIKAGTSCSDFEKSFAFPLEEICTDIGTINIEKVPELLAIADVLIQPGQNNQFNRDRFPCKIPDFLASGRPCILPRIYQLDNDPSEPYCLFLDRSDPREIADQAKRIFEDPELARSLGENARSYVADRFDRAKNYQQLLDFYQRILNAPSRDRKGVAYRQENFKAELQELRLQRERLESRLAGASDELRDANHAIRRLEAKVDELCQSLANQSERVQRIKSTASWKLTSPLRSLRRAFVDPFRKANSITASPRSEPSPSASATSDQRKLPPEGHPSYHKEYYKFVQSHQEAIASYLANFDRSADGPLISILLPVYNVAEKWLRRCIDSVLEQAYPNWELCIADDCSDAPHVRSVIEQYQRTDQRIRCIFRESNGHISQATNSAFTLSSGDYIALLDHDDELAPHALARLVEAIREVPAAKLIYSDEDKIDENGLRHGPHFKCDWNYELFLGCNMISHLGVYRRDVFEAVGGFRVGYEGAQDWDLALRVIEKIDPSEILHIPDILYHWRNIEGSTAHDLDHKDYANAAQKRAIESHLERVGVAANLESVDGFDWKVNYPIPKPAPSVSIIIPTRDRKELLESCIQSIIQKTDYPNYEILIADNESRDPETLDYLKDLVQLSNVRVVAVDGAFNFSRINNRTIETCQSDYVCLLNNDIEVISENWLSEMMSHACRNEIGVVGAKLLYPHDHVQHGGVIMGIGGVAAHAFKYLHRDDDGHIHRAHLVSGYSAVTGACMVFSKDLWRSLGGFDEVNLPISYNDVDFCLRTGAIGKRVIATPFALLYHKESESRGDPTADAKDKSQFENEIAYMRQKWSAVITRDPYYNPNLTRDREDFSYISSPSLYGTH
ncbi:glycosyltransferase [Pelagicoccus sp. SDUM812003]|uniref:glycosyltransferase n=1 Tax=Pelagicoccus sp. SDUM812003 TaxID=3041267 RepID=UPI00280E17F8|nr:glycosyltransferase [Pelagicoccus sp. SDUM812003]MDQ8202512.1 glycosyltransferase [Pelagicoccus sp. SDUM812003]